MWVLIIIFVILAMVYFAVTIPVIVLVAVGATIHYFATIKWDNEIEKRNGLISLALLVGVILVIVGVYASYGWAGIIVGILIILVIAGLFAGG